MKQSRERGSILVENCLTILLQICLLLGILNIGWRTVKKRVFEHNLAVIARKQITQSMKTPYDHGVQIQRTKSMVYAQAPAPQKKTLRLSF